MTRFQHVSKVYPAARRDYWVYIPQQYNPALPAAVSDLVNVAPLLGPLQDNGGATETHALLVGSPARDAIPAAVCTDLSGAPVTEDQRGVSRPQGPLCDIGSFEALAGDADLSLTTRVSSALAFEGDPVVFSVQIVNRGPRDATGVTARDDLSAGLSLLSFQAIQGGYVAETGTWSVGRVQVGSTANLTLTTRVEAGTAGTALAHSASIAAAAQPDPVPENNASVVSVTIVGPLAVYLPSVFKEQVAFPIHDGDAIPRGTWAQ